ncbi:MAG: hypothetical protein OXD46_00550 [Chloroflexi bacterium]|nr:hypothetical protein [Chloroflexota bacterium]
MIQPGARFPNEQVGRAVHWYFNGLSYRAVAQEVAKVFGTDSPNRTSVSSWVQEYSRAAANALRHHRIGTGEKWLVEAFDVRLAGRDHYLWNVMDRESHYLLVSYLTNEWSVRVVTSVMERAEAAAVSLPETGVAYQDYSDVFWLLSKDDARISRYFVEVNICQGRSENVPEQ